MQHWYVVHTKPRQEEVASAQLERQGFEVYLPRLHLRKRGSQGWREVIEPLFPRYLFLHVDPDVISIAPIRSTLGVSNLVRFGMRIGDVPASVIAYLKQSENPETGVIDANPQDLVKGERVEIVEGPFAGMHAVFQQANSNDRAMVLIEMLGRQSLVSVSKDSLVKQRP